MSAAITLQNKSENLTTRLNDVRKAKQQLPEQSPNNLRLFTPRVVACRENVATKIPPRPYHRSIIFEEAGELVTTLKIEEQVLELRAEEEEECIIDFNSSSESVQIIATTSCSDATPNTKNNELALVPVETPNSNAPSNNKFLANKTNGTVSNGFRSNSLSIEHSFENRNSSWENSNNKYENGKPCTSHVNGNSSRKRLLSDRGEQESQYPRVDRGSIFSSWDGCPHVNGKRCAAGLYNPLNNCFLNSVLQAVAHIPHLARMILESKDGRMCKSPGSFSGDCFHCALKGHILRVIKANQNSLHTGWIQPFMRRIFPQHRNGVQEDAHEMLTLLLGALELVPPKQTLNGLKVHGPTPSTPIEQIFGGNLRNQVCCNTCKTQYTNYERIREMNLGITRTNRSSIKELFADFFRAEQLQFFCSKCAKKQNSTRTTYLLSAPTVLIIQLKRFNAYGGKNRTVVTSNHLIDLSDYSFRGERLIYRFHGLIQHIGGGLNFGHYVCAMRGFNNTEMFRFDDSERTPVNPKSVAESMEPYIVFYTMMNSASAKANQRRSFDGCQPNYAKQPRVDNNNNNRTFGPKYLNQTVGSFAI